MKIFLPYRAEFGFIVMVHAPQVHYAINEHDEQIQWVCCEQGNEALYPKAMYYFVERRVDCERREFLERDLMASIKMEFPDSSHCEFIEPDMKAPRSYFVPEPTVRYKIASDIVVCPRKREYGSDKNWPHWSELTEKLKEDYQIGAVGAPDSSEINIEAHIKAWEYPRFLDATIELMLSAKLVIATDSGLAHLANMCGVPLLLISYKDGRVAPGHDDVGREYWPIRLDRYAKANHTGSAVNMVNDTWNDLNKIIHETRRML